MSKCHEHPTLRRWAPGSYIVSFPSPLITYAEGQPEDRAPARRASDPSTVAYPLLAGCCRPSIQSGWQRQHQRRGEADGWQGPQGRGDHVWPTQRSGSRSAAPDASRCLRRCSQRRFCDDERRGLAAEERLEDAREGWVVELLKPKRKQVARVSLYIPDRPMDGKPREFD